MKYVLYAWKSDNEGGHGVFEKEKFTPDLGYEPESGWRARPSVAIGEFDTVGQLAQIMMVDDPGMFTDFEEAERGAELLMKLCGVGDE